MQTTDYRRGYLCGMIRGDGHLGTYRYERAGRATAMSTASGSRSSISRRSTGRASSSRARASRPTEFAFAPATGRTGRCGRSGRRRASECRADPRADRAGRSSPSDDWCKGFLAGIFDAEGSCSGGVLRISNTDPDDHRLDRRLPAALRLRLRRRGPRHANGARDRPHPRRPARAPALLPPHRPGDHAQARHRGHARSRRTPSSGSSRSSRSATTLRLYDITTGTGDFIANGVVSHNCFARPTHTYLDLNAGARLRARDRRQGQRARGAAAPSWRGRRGRASTSRWARTPTPTSGSRAATS